jgi:NAD(P)H-hydrate epimerase
MTASSFVTNGGVVVPAITADQMREVDRIAVEETGPNLYQMMENAGRNLALSAIELLGPAWRTGSVVVLAGTGGNGGGGICAARHLANRGVDVSVAVTDESGLREVPAQQLAIYRGTRGQLIGVDHVATLDPSLIIDAVIGYSLAGPLRGAALHLIEWANETAVPCLCLDVPSGLDSTTGESLGARVTATRTTTLALPKTGLDSDAVGDLWLADIGIPTETYRRAGLAVPSGIFGDEFTVPIEARSPPVG